jgi:hypothetical protein
MPFGASVLAAGGVRFALWAPDAGQVTLEHGFEGDAVMHAMTREASGWHRIDLTQARAGDNYRFLLPDGLRVEWTLGDGTRLRLLAHFGAQPAMVPTRLAGERVYSHGARDAADDRLDLDPGAVHVLIQPANV